MAFLVSLYRAIMDSDANALRTLAPAQRFQIMTYLGFMWTVIFCLGAGAWIWFGELLVAHVLVALGFAITGWTFGSAGRQRTVANRVKPRSDETVRSDHA